MAEHDQHEGEETFIRINNAQIYAEIQELKAKVSALNIKFYGIAAGLLAALGLLINQRGLA